MVAVLNIAEHDDVASIQASFFASLHIKLFGEKAATKIPRSPFSLFYHYHLTGYPNLVNELAELSIWVRSVSDSLDRSSDMFCGFAI